MANTRVSHDTTRPVGRFADYQNQPSVTIDTGLVNVVSPEQNLPNSEYFRTGANAIALSSGSDVSTSGVDQPRRAVFIENPGYLADSVNYDLSRPLPTWTQPMCVFAVNLWFSSRNGIVPYVSDAIEAYNNAYYFRPDWSYAPQQCEWLAQAWMSHMTPVGGSYLGEYGGSFDASNASENFYSIDKFIPGLLNNDVALSLMKQYEPASFPYFKQRIWRYHDTQHKTYYKAHLTPQQNLLQAYLGFQLHNNAMKSGEVNNGGGRAWKLCSFYMKQGSEFMKFTAVDTLPVTGGTLTGNNFPVYSYQFHLSRAFTHWIYCAMQWGWGELVRYGMDVSVLASTFEQYKYNGTGIGVTTINPSYDFQAGGAGIGPGSLGYNLGDYEGTKLMMTARAWCGSGIAAKYLRFRENTSSSSYNVDTNDYVGRQVQNGGGAGFWLQGNTAKRVVFFMPPEISQNDEWRSWVLDVGLSSPHVTPLLMPGYPYIQFFD